jgi:NAD(P)-dependent dehydrogenase (short-subunit alcohol dehydrogenase family)
VSLLQGRTALVTGSSRGIGAAIAELLAAEGARVMRVARTLERRSRGLGHDIPCDLTDWDQVSQLGSSVLQESGAPDIVVSNAGAFLLRRLEATELHDLERQLATNLRAPFALARAFLPAMSRRGQGSFITVGSVADHTGYPENAAYAASKYGLRGLHETLLEEYRGSGVRLTLVSPGPTDTSAWDPFDPDRREGFIPRAGMLKPQDVAEAVLFVATRPAHVLIDWLRLGPTGDTLAADERR